MQEDPTAAAELRPQVDQFRWFPRIDHGNGVVTPGEVQSADKLAGSFYRLPDPWLILRKAASICRRLMIVETHADLQDRYQWGRLVAHGWR